MADYDVLVYRDFTDTKDVPLDIGTPASELGLGDDLHVVAIAHPIHEGKDATIVLAHGTRPMSEIQALLDHRH